MGRFAAASSASARHDPAPALRESAMSDDVSPTRGFLRSTSIRNWQCPGMSRWRRGALHPLRDAHCHRPIRRARGFVPAWRLAIRSAGGRTRACSRASSRDVHRQGRRIVDHARHRVRVAARQRAPADRFDGGLRSTRRASPALRWRRACEYSSAYRDVVSKQRLHISRHCRRRPGAPKRCPGCRDLRRRNLRTARSIARPPCSIGRIVHEALPPAFGGASQR